MKSLIAVSSFAFLGLTACSAETGGGNGAPAPAAGFEAVTISGSQATGDGLIKMNTATGEAWFHCCGTRNNNFTNVRDDTALPPGDYHVVRWDQVDARGDVNWNLYRFDRKTGHTWIFESSDKGGYSWMDVNTTIKWSS